MTESRATDYAERTRETLGQIQARLRTLSADEAAAFKRDLMEELERHARKRIDTLRYETLVAVGKLAIATGDPETLAHAISGVGPITGSDVNSVREMFPGIDHDQVSELADELRALQRQAEQHGVLRAWLQSALETL